MKNFKIVCLIACIAIIIFHLINIDYQDLRFRANKFHYLGIVAMFLVALNFIIGIIKDRSK